MQDTDPPVDPLARALAGDHIGSPAQLGDGVAASGLAVAVRALRRRLIRARRRPVRRT